MVKLTPPRTLAAGTSIGDNNTFKKLIENSFSGITLLNKDLQTIYRSPSAERINGWTTIDRMKNAVEDLIHPDDEEMIANLLREVLDNPDVPKTCIFRAKHFAGHFIWLQCSFTNMLHEPDVNAIVCNFIDISSQKQSEALLRQTIDELSASEHFTKTITDNLPAMIAYWTADLRCLFANKAFLDYYDMKAHEMLGISRQQLMGKDSEQSKTFDPHIRSVLLGQAQSFENTVTKSDGSKVFFHVQYIPDIENRTVKGYYALTYDISEAKIAELEVKKKTHQIEDLLEEKNTILESIDDAFFAIDKDWIVTYWNNMAEKFMGKRRAEVLNKNIWEIYPEAVNSEAHKKYQEVFETNEAVHFELYSIYLKNWSDISIFPAGNGLSVYVKDINERKKAELAAACALEEKNTILETIDDAFFAVDENWIVTYWNNRAESALKMPKNKILGQNLWSVYAHAVDSEMYRKYQEAMKTRNVVEFEFYSEVVKAWLEISIYPATNGLTVFIKDVSDRKKAEAAATQALEERNTILESIDDAFFAVDRNWIVTYWNNMAEQVLMTAKDDILNHGLWEVFSVSVGSESYKKYHEAVETGVAAHFEDYFPPLNKWYEISAYPSVNGLSVYFKDITDRKLSETRLTELNESLQKHAKELSISNAELEQFAYVASHDLQEPLRMVTGFLTQIERKYDKILDDKGKQYIHFAVDGAKRMRQIILDLLEFSRVGQMHDNPEEVNVNNLINDILPLYRKQIEEKKARVEFDRLPTIQTYKVPIRQVFQNLISNSLKYQKSGKSALINISCDETEEYWKFSVSDNGIGIDPEYFGKIFIIFQRLHNKDEYSGTGMGLAVTKKIIENLGGKIWVESEEGKGSTFYFTILKTNYEIHTHIAG